MTPKFSIIITAYNQLPIFRDWIFPALKAQTIPEREFEVIIADDGSSDGLEEYCESMGLADKYVYQEDKWYGYTGIVNLAVKEAVGEYLVFLSGDTYPSPTFLEELEKALKPDRVVNGVRVNVNEVGDHVSEDWRWRFLPHFERMMTKQGVEVFPLHGYPNPWVHFTMNTLAVSRKIWDEVGGLSKEYDGGYGKMDWSFVMKAFFSGYGLWWQTAAVAYHLDDGKPGRPDDDKNTLAFEQEIEMWKDKMNKTETSL